MYFWKIDDETIRCLVNRQEIDKMGYDLEVLDKNDDAMMDFLNDIIDESLRYVDWNPEHGLQNYAARILPANQLLVTISCTYPDDLIDKDLEQIRKLTEALKNKVSPERLAKIHSLSGEEKQKAFDSLTKDLHAIYNGKLEEEKLKENEKRFEMANQIICFESLDMFLQFCRLVPKEMRISADLYRVKKSYELLVYMNECVDEKMANTFLAFAQECDGVIHNAGLRESYLKEHGKPMILKEAMEKSWMLF